MHQTTLAIKHGPPTLSLTRWALYRITTLSSGTQPKGISLYKMDLFLELNPPDSAQVIPRRILELFLKPPEYFTNISEPIPKHFRTIPQNQIFIHKKHRIFNPIAPWPKPLIKDTGICTKDRAIHIHTKLVIKTQNHPYKQQTIFIKQLIQGTELAIQGRTNQISCIQAQVTDLFIKSKLLVIQHISALAPWQTRLTCTN